MAPDYVGGKNSSTMDGKNRIHVVYKCVPIICAAHVADYHGAPKDCPNHIDSRIEETYTVFRSLIVKFVCTSCGSPHGVNAYTVENRNRLLQPMGLVFPEAPDRLQPLRQIWRKVRL